MTETTGNPPPRPGKAHRRRRRCLILGGAVLFFFFILFIVFLILALTVFKFKEPKVDLLSASLDGVSPRISFPVINIQLNVTLNLKLLVHNPNHASFKHGPGKSILLYRENQVGEADLDAGLIPSRGTATLACRLTIEVDQIASNIETLVSDILAGQVVVDARTRIPGRANILGIIKRHAVAISACRFTFDIPAMKILSQECKSESKL